MEAYKNKQKTPPKRGFKICSLRASRRCHRGAALPSMNGLFIFLARFQLHFKNI